jgi:chromosome segregation ATPase
MGLGEGEEAAVAAEAAGMLDAEDERILAGIGDNPLLERVQASLREQLQRRLDRTLAELRGKKEDAERLHKDREDVGVALYEVQQQLVKLQARLQSANSSLEVLVGMRERAEGDVVKFRAGLEERRRQVAVEESKVAESRAELDGITDTLRQVTAYDEEMAADIALTRRAAYKTEEDVVTAEKGKRVQDLYIDELSARLKRLGDELAQYDAQLKAQEQESAQAEATLRAAQTEMQAIRSEKKELLVRWQSTLSEIRRRDEALEAVRSEIRLQQESYEAMNAEEANVRKAMRRAQEEQATLQGVLEREQSHLTAAEATMVAAARQREALEERREMLASSLEAAEAELSRLGVARERAAAEVREAVSKRALVEKQRQAMEAGVEDKESAQVTARKAARNLTRDAQRVLERIHGLERELAAVDNEMARVRVDAFAAQAHVDALRAEVDRAEGDVRDREQTVARQQLEIRQRHDEIEKKMAVVDRLNRRYERLVADLPEEEHMGPLHATVHNTTKAIAEVRTRSDELQRRWLAKQTALVAAEAAAEEKAVTARELVSQRVLLEQKRMRLDKAVDAARRDTRELASELARMREDMARMNALVARNAELAARLADAAVISEKEFTEELKDLERESAEMDARLAALKEEKARLLEDILEAERQAALWEKKLTLEKETQAALDPSVGKSEIGSMEREIHRMRLRLDAHQRKQEALVQELERAVAKREDIAVRFENKRRDRGEGPAATQGGVLRRRATLKRDIRAKADEQTAVAAALRAKADELAAVEQELADAQRDVDAREREAEEIQAGINAALYDKQRDAERVAALRHLATTLTAFAVGAGARVPIAREAPFPQARAPLSTADAEMPVRAAEAEAEEERTRVRQLLDELVEKKPDLADLLERVGHLTMLVE